MGNENQYPNLDNKKLMLVESQGYGIHLSKFLTDLSALDVVLIKEDNFPSDLYGLVNLVGKYSPELSAIHVPTTGNLSVATSRVEQVALLDHKKTVILVGESANQVSIDMYENIRKKHFPIIMKTNVHGILRTLSKLVEEK